MRHRKAGLKLNRTSSHRKAMFRNMVTSLFKHERIRTTDVKAKELRRWADNLITLAKRGDVHARRQALSIVREKDVVHKLFAEVSEKYGAMSGGYTRIVKLGRRRGDAAPISLIELVYSQEKKKKKKKKKIKAKPPVEKAPVIEEKPDFEVVSKEKEVSKVEEEGKEEKKDLSKKKKKKVSKEVSKDEEVKVEESESKEVLEARDRANSTCASATPKKSRLTAVSRLTVRLVWR